MGLLSLAQQQAIKPIAKNNQQIFDQLETDVENLYLSKILGIIFAQKVQETPTSYVDLLDGCSFEYIGQTISHKGIRFVLAHYVFAEYVKNSDVSDTYTGLVQQNRQETTHLSSGRINAIRDSSLSIADQGFELVKLYLNQNYQLYPFWNVYLTEKPHSAKLIEIRNTGHEKYSIDRKFRQIYPFDPNFNLNINNNPI